MPPRLTSPAAVAAMLVAMMATPAFATDYVQAPGSSLVFATKYDGEVFTGQFGGFSTKLSFDPVQLAAAKLDVTIQLVGTSTGNADRDGHLKSADFFKIDEFPTMTFRSTKAESLGGEDYRITGDLSLLGVTRPITIDLEFNGVAKDPFGNERAGFEGKAELLRSEWGLTWNAALETGGVLISDKIKLNFDVSAIKNA